MEQQDNFSLTSHFNTESTSLTSSEINQVVLCETNTTRRILESKIVKNTKDPNASLHITIVHEKKSPDGWTTDSAPKLSTLKRGEWVSCDLDSATTLTLYDQLSKQYALANNVGVENYKNNYLVIKLGQDTSLSPSDEDALTQILTQCSHSPNFAKKLSQLNPDLIKQAYDHQILQHKIDGLATFKVMLEEEKNCTEQEWQDFFKEHGWILGGIHDIQYLSDLIDQPNLAAANVSGVGAKRGDFLTCTPGHARFTAIVEIKKGITPLLKSKPYRNDIYIPSPELIGGVSQLRFYLRKWQIEGSNQENNRDYFEGKGVYTVQPQGFLIVGNLLEIQGNRQMREAFELFRNNQKDIYIITYDEVYARAKQLVGIDEIGYA